MSSLLQKFPNLPPRPYIKTAEGIYLVTDDGRRLMDATAGSTSFAVLGYDHPEVLDAMREQMERFCHVDYNVWRNRTLEELADLLVSQAPAGLDRVYFCGNSGSEAIEAAMKLSYQVQYDAGKPEKSWFISREQSFHGATLQGIAMSELPILEFYENILPQRRARIPQHHALYWQEPKESLDDYARRGAKDLEAKIMEIGPERVCAFVGETMLGSLVGDVPPAPNYWRYIREVCNRYGVHLILDEIYCGNGRTGRSYCCSWDEVIPDFICLGKPLAAGYVPLSAVVTKREFEQTIANGQGRIQHGHTHQGHSLAAAAALAVQKVIHRPETLRHIETLGKHCRARLKSRLSEHPIYRDIRGRGLLFSLEYDLPRQPEFSAKIAEIMERRHGILVNAKWHRVSFTPPYTITTEEAERLIDAVADTIEELADGWT
jgi:adenosylmethionine-8-amino-7-oxononanoate aminotransferase